jgi:hypothetical protein
MSLLVKILIRQARRNNSGNPVLWLEDLQAAKWTDLNTQNGQITGTSVNGKSVNLQVLPGVSLADVMGATELAIETINAGLDAYPSTSAVRFR